MHLEKQESESENLEGPQRSSHSLPLFMDEEVGTQERGSALFRVLAGQTKMRIHIKHADIKFYMFKKKKKDLFPPDFLLSRKVAGMYHKRTFTSTNVKIQKVMFYIMPGKRPL